LYFKQVRSTVRACPSVTAKNMVHVVTSSLRSNPLGQFVFRYGHTVIWANLDMPPPEKWLRNEKWIARWYRKDWKQLMLDHDVPYTEEIFATIDRIQEIIKNIDRYTDTDVWEDVGSEVGQKVIVEGEKMTEEATEEGGNLWDRIKAWWNE
jgi:hypothetical protein